jgi:glycosyltransferase involved in cell wall biosynthesis
MTLAATVCLGTPVIVRERTTPWRHELGQIWRLFRWLLYPFAERVVVQTEAVRRAMKYVSKNRLEVIPNPAPPADGDVRSCGYRKSSEAELRNWLGAQSYVLAVGRLEPVKGFDLLLRAYAEVVDSIGDTKLVILGEGTQRAALAHLAVELGISRKVFMPGLVDNPILFMRGAEAFVLSSRFEGFPNALLEAMSVGTPAISFDCEHGPADLIRSGHNGLLVPPEDVGALAAAMRFLLADRTARAKLGAAATEVSQRFSVEAVMTRWSTLVREVVCRKQ